MIASGTRTSRTLRPLPCTRTSSLPRSSSARSRLAISASRRPAATPRARITASRGPAGVWSCEQTWNSAATSWLASALPRSTVEPRAGAKSVDRARSSALMRPSHQASRSTPRRALTALLTVAGPSGLPVRSEMLSTSAVRTAVTCWYRSRCQGEACRFDSSA
jgi:hypothetical protein